MKPFISPQSNVREMSPRALVMGIILGLVFGVGNAYLGLKVGTTVSASIPAAVMSMTILRLFFRNVTILENNIVQTIASVGEGLAAGVIFTAPALFLLGETPDPSRIFMLAALGGILGVLFMIPMRRYIIVKEHGKLPFPEGTACAEILKSGEENRPKALIALVGMGIGAFHKICSNALNLWKETATWTLKSFEGTLISIDCTPALLGVGFIIGPRISALVFAGGALGWWILIPLIKIFSDHVDIIYPGDIPVSLMTSTQIWSNYIRYMGVGAVATGGIISLFKIAPLIFKTVHVGVKELFQRFPATDTLRTDRDISLRWLILGSVFIILTLWLFPGLPLNFVTILLLVILGFFFSAVTSITVGLVGSTSNPVSGMTITTLLITCLLFVILGWTDRFYLVAALTMSIVANVAICLAGTTSQDLKTGYILGATPKLQQIAEIIGVIFPALAISGTLYLLNETYQFGSAQLPAPQATMMALIAKGVISGDIPFNLVLIGIMIGLLLQVLRIPILPFAIGLYLPLSLSTPIIFGGIASAVVNRYSKDKEADERGILASSGLVAGDACMGVIIAFLTVMGWVHLDTHSFFGDNVSLFVFLLMAMALAWFSIKPPKFLMQKSE